MSIIALLREAARRWVNDQSLRLSASLAFYTLFSLAPLLLVLTSFAGLVFGPEAARGYLDEQMQSLIGRESADLLQQAIANARRPSSGILAAFTGVGATLLGATAVFSELQASLNAVWDVPPRAGGIVQMLRARLTGFTLVISTGFLLLVSLALTTILTIVGTSLGSVLPISTWILEATNFAVSFALTTLLFASIFKILPDTRIEWKDVWFGGVATAALFTVGKSAIGFYVVRTSVASTYGAAGALVLVLLWVYYSALVLFFGAELTRAYEAQRRVGTAEPARETEPTSVRRAVANRGR